MYQELLEARLLTLNFLNNPRKQALSVNPRKNRPRGVKALVQTHSTEAAGFGLNPGLPCGWGISFVP